MAVLTMKVMVVLLGLITATLSLGKRGKLLRRKIHRQLGSYCVVPSTQLTGVAATTVRIRAYNATGELDVSNNVPEHRDAFTLGTRVLLTCDVKGLLEGSEVVSYRWFHNCMGSFNSGCEMRNREPYYRIVDDTILVDVISQDQGGRYYCFVKFSNIPQSSHFTSNIAVAG